MDKDKKICYCFNVSVEDIERAIENGATSFDEVIVEKVAVHVYQKLRLLLMNY